MATEAEANDVLDEIGDGGDIEAIAVERSIDPSGGHQRRTLDGGESGCLATSAVSQGIVP